MCANLIGAKFDNSNRMFVDSVGSDTVNDDTQIERWGREGEVEGEAHNRFHNRFPFSVCVFAVKPFLIRGPQNQTAVVGNSVTFQCRVGGEPVPDVLWRRTASGGNMPLGE